MKKFKVQNSESKSAVGGRRSAVGKSKLENRREKNENRILKTKDQRPKSEDRRPNLPLIFGVLPVLEALRAENRRIEKILIADGAHEKRLHEILTLARQNGVQFQKVPRSDLSKFVEEGANHQGIIAFTAAADYVDAGQLLEEITTKENSLSVILDGVEDPRNLGAILRTVECAAAVGVFIPERRAVGLTETVAKSSAGATEYVKVAKVANINRLIEELKENNVWIVGTSATAEMNYTDWDWSRSSALVLGGEGKGLHRLTAEKCDVLVKIPLLGKIESLNVSVACGVILFEAVRQRNQSSKFKVRTEQLTLNLEL
ncbi:MAG: 23S rRNA (guanosine(2251)-2'-O)-methyltransferase RlmB [Acidobacteriota bacterium]|nr:23S rRNA (guanosine(2251)-2'-O)-methyltransferase RlmB [Acidobacteriota bacterium]